MKNKIILATMLPTFCFGSNFVTIIDGADKTYLPDQFTQVIEYTEWVDKGAKTCSFDKETSDYYFGVPFEQTENCSQEQERTKTTTNTYKGGKEEVIVEKETKTLNTTSKNNVLGSHLERSCLNILNNGYSSGNGTYHIKPNTESVETYCDMNTDGGGWTMVASNSVASSIIAKGTSRNSANYRLDRSSGSLGIADPNSDYIIGYYINDMDWTHARITMFGFNDHLGSYSFPSNLGRYMDIKWTTEGNTPTDRFNNITPVASVSTISSNNFSFHTLAKYFVLDAVYKDNSYNANSNQSTVGGAGVANANGDPSNGTYFGHGTEETSTGGEGAYIAGGSSMESYGYVTWIR
tara:strand:- start:9900 stop:10949 length:1050 start_codon:yes stop_codon:yes gene_type:complete